MRVMWCADLVEVERQIMLWERKIQLEKEMQVCTGSILYR